MRVTLVAGAVASAFASAHLAWAQEATPAKPDAKPEVKAVEKITVTATPLGREEAEMAQPATVLTQDDLRRKRAASIGDTLSQEVGVQSSAFGAAAGRPIIRGLDGPRIRVLENGVGTGDVSSVSPDHAVTTESLRAEQIEILRGPASLLYGSGAIGGVVNVVSNTVPRKRPENGFEGEAEMRLGSANRERTASASLDGGGDVAFHIDGYKRRASDYDTPLGRLADSDIDARGAALGASWLTGRGFVGAGAQRHENDYGVPTGEGTRIRMRQNRYEIAGQAFDPLPGFTQLDFRVSNRDYQHREIESTGEVATTLKNRSTEARVEMRHGGILQGTVGAQFQGGEQSALGEEAILPKTKTRANALFVVEQKELGTVTLDAGLRFERETRRPEAGLQGRDFSLVTPAAGVVFKLAKDYRFSVNATQAQRAPSVEELYSNGFHAATDTFDIGDPALKKEVSRNVDVTLRKVAGDSRWRVNAYYNRIRDYVYGALEPGEEFRTQRYAQQTASFRGIEAEWSLKPAGAPYGLRLFGDLTRAKLADGTNAPRIAPGRLGMNLDLASGPLSGSATVIRSFEQTRIAPFETPTAAYTRVDAEVSWRLQGQDRGALTVFLQGSNLTDEVIRLHTSYLKDVAPLMGRSVTLGLRGEF